MSKIILDLCGGTGAWSKPYADAGYGVRVITHPQYDVFDYNEYKSEIKDIHGILAAPTCTMFSLARTTAKTPRDLEGGYKLVDRCLEIVRDCRINGNLKFWALENPVGYLRQLLGKPPLTFDPCDYGATYTKKTDLWGYYNFLAKKNENLPKKKKPDARSTTENCLCFRTGMFWPDDFRPQQARRSMTDEHFARAFFKANR